MSRKKTSKDRTVTLGLLQHACSADPAENLSTTLAAADRAARDGAKEIKR